MLKRLIGILALVILGAIAAQQVLRVVTPLIPILLVILVGWLVVFGWRVRKRKP